MTKKPFAFQTWLDHHRALHIVHFFIRVEDTPELVPILQSDDITFELTSGQQSYLSQMDRQNEHVKSSILKAREMGCTHILHIDDDELLHCPNGLKRFHAHISQLSASYFLIQNMEALYDQSNCENPFKSTRYFRTRPWEFSAYANGKSIGNLSDPLLSVEGPHTFTGDGQDLATHVAVILHYESACIEKWRTKFLAYANDRPEACSNDEIPFPFFCESITSVQRGSDETWTDWKIVQKNQEGVLRIDDAVLRPKKGRMTLRRAITY